MKGRGHFQSSGKSLFFLDPCGIDDETNSHPVSTSYAVVIFRVKVSCIKSVDGIELWLST